jgi:hypothetical protein
MHIYARVVEWMGAVLNIAEADGKMKNGIRQNMSAKTWRMLCSNY